MRRGPGGIGEAQLAILRRLTAPGSWHKSLTNGDYRACYRLHCRGFLKRDPLDAMRWAITPAGLAALPAE